MLIRPFVSYAYINTAFVLDLLLIVSGLYFVCIYAAEGLIAIVLD